MSACHESPRPERRDGGPGPTGGRSSATVSAASVALVGNPNVGKSTLFNALTGARQRTMNAPGTTVLLESGGWRVGGRTVELVDLPGTYSLLARSPDELVTAQAVRGDGAVRGCTLAVVVVDATAVARSLYLLAQVAEAGRAAVVVLTMLDLARAQGIDLDPGQLERAIGVPVVPVDARAGRGLGRLADAVDQALGTLPRVAGIEPRALADADGGASEGALDAEIAHTEELFAWVQSVTARVDALRAEPPRRTLSDRIDRVLLNPWAGVPVFLAVVWMLFELSTTVAAPLMDWCDRLVSGPVTGAVEALLRVLWLDGTWVQGLLVDGVLAGVGTVVAFVPLMAVMFGALAALEDCGYMARAAFIADRAMRTIGLDGRAFLPLIIGFGCNLPALAATRTLPHARQRLLTGLLVPVTSCAARLTVYILLATAFFGDDAGTVIFAMYVASVALVVLGGLALRRTAFRDVRREPLVLVLPPYQLPRPRTLATSVVTRVRAFVLRAGQIIVLTLTVVWALMAIPVAGGHAIGDVPIEDSVYGRAAHVTAPLLAPAGFGDWHASAALFTGFVAKEVVVGSFAQTYAVDEPSDPADAGDLGARLRDSFDASSGGHGAAAAAAFMVFALAYTPCAATVAEQRRLFGWRPTLAAVGVQLALAWVLAVAVFRVGVMLG